MSNKHIIFAARIQEVNVAEIAQLVEQRIRNA